MKVAESKRPDEPMGIVISGTTLPPKSTVFLAYEWSPAPTTGEDEPKAS
ncbi:MAG: hypothetical protein AABZ80_03145 [Gemmatimonadota bacterium]